MHTLAGSYKEFPWFGMRIGIYLKREPEAGFSATAYPRAVVAHTLEYLACHYGDEEVVFYAGADILSTQFVHDLSFGPVLTSSAAESGGLTTADRFFRRLPNGARSRVLFRILHSGRIPLLSGVLDRVLLAFYSVFDRLDILHLIGLQKPIGLRVPVVISLPAPRRAEANPPQAGQGPTLTNKGKVERTFTRADSSRHFIASSTEQAKLAQRNLGIDSSSISVVKAGADQLFLSEANLLRAGFPPSGAARAESPPGYLLLLLPRGLCNRGSDLLRAWLLLEKDSRRRGLVVAGPPGMVRRKEIDALISGDAHDKALIRGRNNEGTKSEENEDRKSVEVLSEVEADDLPQLVYNSGLLIGSNCLEQDAPLLLGALALETPLLTNNQTAQLLPESDLLFSTGAEEPPALAAAIETGLGRAPSSRIKGLLRDSSQSAQSELARQRLKFQRNPAPADAKLRTMDQVIADTFDVYRTVHLRYKVR